MSRLDAILMILMSFSLLLMLICTIGLLFLKLFFL